MADTLAHGEWSECADDQGNIYYVKSSTGESAWELPLGAVLVQHEMPLQISKQTLAHDAHLTSDYSLDESLMETIKCAQRRFDIAKNINSIIHEEKWIKSFDPTIRQDYFIQDTTGRISYAKQAADTPTLSSSVYSYILVLQCAFRCALAKSRSRTRAEILGRDPPRHCLGKQNIDKQSELNVITSSTREIDELTSNSTNTNNNDVTWIEMFDPKTKSRYYYNKITCESTLEKQENAILGMKDDEMAAIIKIQCASRNKFAREQMRQEKDKLHGALLLDKVMPQKSMVIDKVESNCSS